MRWPAMTRAGVRASSGGPSTNSWNGIRVKRPEYRWLSVDGLLPGCQDGRVAGEGGCVVAPPECEEQVGRCAGQGGVGRGPVVGEAWLSAGRVDASVVGAVG